MSNCCCAALTVEESGSAALTVTEGGNAALKVGGSFYAVGPPLYTGPHEFTPTQYAQVVEIDGKRAEGDITIIPIPSTYGLITWDGSKLMVS